MWIEHQWDGIYAHDHHRSTKKQIVWPASFHQTVARSRHAEEWEPLENVRGMEAQSTLCSVALSRRGARLRQLAIESFARCFIEFSLNALHALMQQANFCGER